jgi:hypothetical protein
MYEDVRLQGGNLLQNIGGDVIANTPIPNDRQLGFGAQIHDDVLVRAVYGLL